ncbi:MAG: hypothetical protein LBJ80_02165 [Rickettsiales bacterium]|jgi:hypothetical protein|nr:hypothetical protein [Rickettsiales bacterium]MDR1261206.1 hypothetical protein [Rickettsiales bacterium]
MPKSNFVVDLVNAFNLNNYFCDRVNTDFTVDGQKVVGLFAKGTDVARYLQQVGGEIIKQHYSTREVASEYYNLSCFPFVLSANPSKKESGIKGVMKVKLADSANKEVIHNLKIHLVNEFRRAVKLKVIALLEKEVGITAEEGHEWARRTVRIGAFDESNLLKKDYLYCIAFDGKYLEREGYDSETFELFKEMYIQEFNSRLRKCGLKNSDFYHYKDDILYIKKDINDTVVRSVAEYVKKEAAFDFRTPGEEDSKVENLKDVFSSLIFKHTGKFVDAYGYDIFTDKKEIEDGNNFVLIPLVKTCNGQLESLKHGDMYTINIKHNNFLCNIKGKTVDPDVTNCKNPVYAISNKGIAQLLPEIMQYPIAYNERTRHFEFAADLGPSSRVDMESPRHVSSVSFPVPLPHHQEQETGGTRVAVPGVVDTKNNPGPSMSGQGSNLPFEPGPSQPVNTRDLLDAERIKERRNSDGRNLSGVSEDSALSSESDESRPASGMGQTDDSGVYSSQELPTSDSKDHASKVIGRPMGPPPVRVMGNPQNPFYMHIMESRQDSPQELDTIKSDDKRKLDRDCPSRASSRSMSSLNSSSSNTSVGTVIGVEGDSSSESSPSQRAGSEPPAKPFSGMGSVHVAKWLVGIFK